LHILIIFAGLPGVGKTVIARALARALGAVFLRIDSIEQTLRDAGAVAGEMNDSGYGLRTQLRWTIFALEEPSWPTPSIRFGLRERPGEKLREVRASKAWKSKSNAPIARSIDAAWRAALVICRD